MAETPALKRYPLASEEPLDIIRRNECEAPMSLVTSRFQALWNEIERLRAESARASGAPDVRAILERAAELAITTEPDGVWWGSSVRVPIKKAILALADDLA